MVVSIGTIAEPMSDRITRPPAVEPRRPPPDCRYPNRDPRCPRGLPDHRPDSYYRRPVIIDRAAPEPILDIDTLSDDWDGCRSTKLNALSARAGGDMQQANRLDEWLWKNCRSYSQELRELEQDRM